VCVCVCAILGINHLCWHSRVCILSVHRDLHLLSHTHTLTHTHQMKISWQHGQLHQMCPLLFRSLLSNRRRLAWGLYCESHSAKQHPHKANTERETDMRAQRKTFKQSETSENFIVCWNMWMQLAKPERGRETHADTPKLAFAEDWRAQTEPWFGGQLGIMDWRRTGDAHALCPFSPGCQRHLLTLWMAALVPSRRAGWTDSQTTCFS